MLNAITTDHVSRLAGLRVLVVGDISLDEYLYGKPTRLSREAPVPVLELTQRECILGAAANPARNVVALGSSAIPIGIVGNDAEGASIHALFQQEGITPSGILVVDGRCTTTKTRILAHEPPRLPHHVARLDRIERTPLAAADEQRILDQLSALIPGVDAVLCSDYQLGLLTPQVVETTRTLCRQHRVLLTVDAQGNSHYYQGFDLFRCNNVEASASLGMILETETDFQQGVAELHARLGAKLVIVTRGPDGLSLFGDDTGYWRLPAVDICDVYDTTGAGDTFIAVATLALAARLEPYVAAYLANAAAALTVRKFGNTVVSPNELTQALWAAQDSKTTDG